MALLFGFGRFAKEEEREKWRKKFDDLNEKDKEFYHKTLPWMLLASDIHIVSEKTIPAIVKRSKHSKIIETEESDESLGKYLQGFIGFSANVNTIFSGKQWLKKRTDNIAYQFDVPKDKKKRRIRRIR